MTLIKEKAPQLNPKIPQLMLNKKDIALLEGMFDKQEKRLTERFDAKLDALDIKIESELHFLRRDIRDEIHSAVNGAVNASEKRMMKRMDEIKDEIVGSVIDVIDHGILPQIEQLQFDMVTVKRELQLA